MVYARSYEDSRTPKIALPAKLYRYKPPMQSRTQLVGNAPTEQWSARNRLNSIQLWTSPSEKYGGGYGQGPDMHTFWRLLPVELLQAHPEWMAVVDGKRDSPIGTTWGLNLSNTELRKVLVERTLDWARHNPDKKGVWIGQNDGSNPCTCEQCVAFYKLHGGKPSSLIVLLLNELADALANEMPDRVAKTLAYGWSLEPPTNMKVRDNAMIIFTAPGAFSVPIAQDPHRKVLRQAIMDWRKIAKNLEIYLYAASPENYWFVEPATLSAAQNIQWAHRSGITNVFTHVSGFGNSFGSESMYLRAWLYARLSWDPTQNPQALIEDFVRGYYGEAADAVLKATELVHRSRVLASDGGLRRFNHSTVVPSHIDPQTIRRVNVLYEKTCRSLKSPLDKKRLSMDWIGYLWTDIWLGFNEAGRYDAAKQTWSVPLQDAALRRHYAKLVRQFMMDNKVDALREQRALNPARLTLDKMGVAWPATQVQTKNAGAIVVPEIGGKITGFRDARTNFEPIKPYWGYLMTEYPQSGSWRDLVNGEQVDSYSEVDGEKKENVVAMVARAGGARVEKRVSMRNDVLEISMNAASEKAGPLSMSSSFMLDMQDKAFGDHPTVYVEKRDGSWAKRVLGTETTFWYIAGEIDLTNATGRMLIAAEKRPEGLLLSFDPAQIKQLSFEYDSYANWPGDQGHMIWFSPTNSADNIAPGEDVALSFRLQIMLRALDVLTPPSR